METVLRSIYQLKQQTKSCGLLWVFSQFRGRVHIINTVHFWCSLPIERDRERKKWIGSSHSTMDYYDTQYQSTSQPLTWKLLFYSNILIAIHLSLSHGWSFETSQNVHVNRHGFELIQANNLQRQELMQSVCEQYFDPNDQLVDSIPIEKMDHLLIDEKHKFLYCYVPKVSVLWFLFSLRWFVSISNI